MGDYKYDIQILAEELASELYDKDYYELAADVQFEVYMAAYKKYWDTYYDK